MAGRRRAPLRDSTRTRKCLTDERERGRAREQLTGRNVSLVLRDGLRFVSDLTMTLANSVYLQATGPSTSVQASMTLLRARRGSVGLWAD